MTGLTFDVGIRCALPCYGWRVYFRGIAHPFDTRRGSDGAHALEGHAMARAWARVQRQTRRRAALREGARAEG